VAAMLLAPLLCGVSVAAQNASEPSLADQVKHQYKLTKLGADSNVLEAGTLLVIQTEGILGVPQGSADLCPTTYEDGALRTPSADDKAQCGKNVRKLNTGEKVYVLKIDVDPKKDRLSLLVVECGPCNGATQLASYKSPIIFQFPNGYLAGADAGQIEDVISQFLRIDDGGKDAQQPVQGSQSSPAGLTNEEVIKLVQAKLPDSVILAKIKSSSCEFDTSTDALIKLKRAGVSDVVLKAIVEAPPPSNPQVSDENPAPADPSKQPDVTPGCGNYDSCIKIAAALLESSQSARALARFQEASQLDPSKGDAWAGAGNAYFQLGQYDDAVAQWDKALQLGYSLSINVCHAKALCGDTGTFLLSTKEISFVSKKGEKELVATPSSVTSEGALLVNTNPPSYYLRVRFAGKNYSFYYLPKAVQCHMGFICPEPGATQQKIFGDYVHERLVRMAAGDFGSQANKH